MLKPEYFEGDLLQVFVVVKCSAESLLITNACGSLGKNHDAGNGRELLRCVISSWREGDCPP